jgi:fructose-bisphosphate aldolase class II
MFSKKINKKYYFNKAQKEGWALGHFNFSTIEILRGIFQAAQILESPIIVGASEGESSFLGLEEAVVMKRIFSEKYGVPALLNLDHGKSLDYIKKAILAGYDLVHFDGSRLPLEENIKITKEIIKFARKKNVLVEGEVGIVGGSSIIYKDRLEAKQENLTDPESALRFVKETKVGSLAINIGTFHGMDQSGMSPHINLQRLKEIKEKIGDSARLVLHGGSGTPEEDIKEAIKLGIVKININTEIRLAFANAIKKSFEEDNGDIVPYKFLLPAILGVQRVVEEKIKLFGSNNKK